MSEEKQNNFYKSQKGQDRWVLEEILPQKRNGFFLDLAAADGLTHSNSYTLEKEYNWTGICIEPNPVFFEQLRAHRDCVCIQAAISNQIEKVNFRVDNGQLGGIVADDLDNCERIRGEQLKTAEILSMTTRTLMDVLVENNAPAVIDYFSLDVEGAEERIVSSMDFNQYVFKTITIERPTPRVNEILFQNGYIFVKNFRFDSFYVHPDIKNQFDIACAPFEQIPPKNW